MKPKFTIEQPHDLTKRTQVHHNEEPRFVADIYIKDKYGISQELINIQFENPQINENDKQNSKLIKEATDYVRKRFTIPGYR